ncbi:hypothetical protein BOX15_Mlig030870g3, partial [Macrostomum lignano]
HCRAVVAPFHSAAAAAPEPPLIRPMPDGRCRFDRRRRVWQVDTATRIEIIGMDDCRSAQHETYRGCRCRCHRGGCQAIQIYFTTDGTEPNPVHRWEPDGKNKRGREVTFLYEGPFCLNAGNRTVRALAVVGGCLRRRHCCGLNCSATEVAEFLCRPWRYDEASAVRSAQSDLLSGSASGSDSSSSTSSSESEAEAEDKRTQRKVEPVPSSPAKAAAEPASPPSEPSSSKPRRKHFDSPGKGRASARCCCGGTQINLFGGGKWNLQPVKDAAEPAGAETTREEKPPSVLLPPPPVVKKTDAPEDEKGEFDSRLKSALNDLLQSDSAADFSLPPSPPSEQSSRESQVVPKTAKVEESAMPDDDAIMAEARGRFLSLGGPETLDVVSPVRVLMEDSEQPSTTMWERTEQLVGMVEEAKREQSGTLHPAENFRPTEDAEAIQRALNESPVDQKSIIDILTRRVASQRAAISAAFADIDPDGQCLSEKFPEPGAPDAKDFDRLCGLLCLDQSEFDACQLRQALESPQADEASLIEIFCSRTQSKIEAAKMAYRQMYGRSFAEDALEGISGPFKTLLNGLAGRSRPEGAVFDCDQARRDGRTLADESPAGWAAGGRLTELLTERSNAHMRAAFAECQRLLCGEDSGGGGIENLASMVKLRVPAGGGRKRLLTLLRCLCSRPGYFANLLNKAVHGTYHDDRVVLRVVISRCEVDMVQIKEAFLAAHGDALASCLRGFAGGVYHSGLLQLIGEGGD